MRKEIKRKRLKEKYPATYEFLLGLEQLIEEKDPDVLEIIERDREEIEKMRAKKRIEK